MSDQEVPGGDPKASGGSDNPEKKDMVSYESHKKLLDEKKKADARLKEFEDRDKKRAEDEAKQKEDWKALLETREKENETLKGQLKEQSDRLDRGIKLNAFLENLDGSLDRQYWKLINLESVTLDGEGIPDEVSLKKAVKDFQATYPDVIKKQGGKMPNDAPGGVGNSITTAEWEKLPYEEQRKRIKDIKDL